MLCHWLIVPRIHQIGDHHGGNAQILRLHKCTFQMVIDLLGIFQPLLRIGIHGHHTDQRQSGQTSEIGKSACLCLQNITAQLQTPVIRPLSLVGDDGSANGIQKAAFHFESRFDNVTVFDKSFTLLQQRFSHGESLPFSWERFCFFSFRCCFLLRKVCFSSA